MAFVVHKHVEISIRHKGACNSFKRHRRYGFSFQCILILTREETLSLRVERHTYNTLKVVEYLNNYPRIESVSHPSVSTDSKQQELYKKYFPNGGGSIFTFDIKGMHKKLKIFIDNLELFSLLANVADVKSLVIHPVTTHSQCTE